MMKTGIIKVLIVDDDTIVRRGLRATVEWEKFGMTVVADAPNGKRGWEEFLNHQPDIVITDIVMPEENGLEFSRKIKAHAPNTKILLLSCHKDFEYAQEGLKLGASGYLLKTVFDDQELEHFLTAFQKEIEGTPKKADTDFSGFQECFLLWLSGYKNDFEQRLDELFSDKWRWMNDSYFAYFVQNMPLSGREIFPPSTKFVTLTFGTNLTYFFIEESFHTEFLALLTETRVAHPDLNWIHAGPLSGKGEWMKSVRGFHQAQRRDGHLHHYPTVILHAVEYIVRNLSNPMTVSDIADEVGMSRSHLSTLFKKKMGDSIHSFIEKKRLQLTKQLLKDSSVNIQEIGEQIGIQDAKYFSKWFKRCTGFPPSYYRIQQKDDEQLTK